jgi:hypothetical protein
LAGQACSGVGVRAPELGEGQMIAAREKHRKTQSKRTVDPINDFRHWHPGLSAPDFSDDDHLKLLTFFFERFPQRLRIQVS